MNAKQRIGIFGGSFNPFHVGHLASLLTVQRHLGLERVYVVPTAQTPMRSFIEGPSPQQRWEMVKLSLDRHKETLIASDIEIQRGGMSYTIDTLREIAALHPEAELFLIIGADQFDNFMLWRSFDKIFEIANVVVTSRPGAHLPARLEELPARLRDYVEIFDADEATLTTGRLVKFLALNDIDISASEIRRRIRARQSVDKFLAPRAIEYIEKHRLYAPYSDRVRDFAEFTRFCANQLFERKAIQVRAFDLRELDKPSEFALIGSGSSTRHTSALADYVLRRVKEEFGFYPYNIEGQSEGRWVVLDYGALILHLFYDFARSEYKLEDLWKDGRELQLTDPFAARSEAPDASAIPHVPNKS